MKTLCLLLLLMFQTSRARPQEVGVITGVIRKADGQAAAGVRVFARTSTEISQDKGTIEAQAETDAEGRYRFEIRPGQYFIGAGFIHAPTWYPGATDLAGAKPVRVLVNATIAIDINAQPMSISGSLQAQAISAKGLPLPNVTVTLTGNPRARVDVALATEQTDAAGMVVFRNLAQGSYVLRFAYPGYISSSVAVPLDKERSWPSVQFQWKMVPNAIISGFVKDPSGKPVRAEVWAGRIEERDGRRQFVRMVSEITSDQGHYVLVPPEPGSYFVATRLPGGLDSTYYPGTRTLDEAQPLTVLDGETLGGIELLILPPPK
jgi:5-hydroxyisourate hydrolase-like protein (transthyretin family)